MKNKRNFNNIACFLFIFGVLISNSFAGLVDSSSVDIVGNIAAPEGSFTVQVDYWLYDGTSGADPLGITPGEYQATFQLTHLGQGGEPPTVDIGRFTVFTELTAPGDGGPAYSYNYNGAFAVDDPGSAVDIAPIFIQTATAGQVEYFFTDFAMIPTFAPGDLSQLLVMTFDAAEVPILDLLIEIDESFYGINGDTRIDLIPEPATLLLLGSGAVLLRVRRKRHAA